MPPKEKINSKFLTTKSKNCSIFHLNVSSLKETYITFVDVVKKIADSVIYDELGCKYWFAYNDKLIIDKLEQPFCT